MAVDTEAIMTALASRLSSIPGVVTFNRKWRSWEGLSAAEQPALFMTNGNQIAKAQRSMPTVWTLLPTLYLYTRHDADPAATGATVQNQLLKAVVAALQRTPGEVAQAGPFVNDGQDPHTTLGGLVSACYINGTIETDEGLLQNQGVAIIPIEIVTTD